MDVIIVLSALAFLMIAAYRGYSVILFAPIAALAAVVLTDYTAVAPVFSALFMDKMSGFVRTYFPVFMLGAIFGKLIEISGFSSSIVQAVIRLFGPHRAILSIALVSMLLTYGGVSVFVVVFAAYPFAAALFRAAEIPKRLIPATIALGGISFTMDALPGSPQIQNIIPTTFFGTTAWAAPILGLAGSAFTFVAGFAYLEWCRIRAAATHETYGNDTINEPTSPTDIVATNPIIAILPLITVGVTNLLLSNLIAAFSNGTIETTMRGLDHPIITQIASVAAIWAVEGALIAGCLVIVVFAFARVKSVFIDSTKVAIGGAMLATMNTASEYGFGSVIAALPGFIAVKDGLHVIGNPLINEAITITTLSGMTGSASGGLSIALAAMAKQFSAAGQLAGISPEVLHRVASMASGGMDTLPHNGAIITLLAVTGLTHRQAYRNIFVLTLLKTLAVFFVIALYYSTGLI